VGFLGQLDSRASAVYVVHPDLARPKRALIYEVFANKDVLAVGGPRRAVDEAIFLFGYLPSILSVRVHHPDVIAAVAIRREGDEFAVRAETRLAFPRDASGEQLGFAASDRHAVDVAQKIKDDRLAVGGNIAAHPGAFVGVELYEGRWAVVGFDIPRLVLFLIGL